MAFILSIETSTKSCSTALHQDGELVGLNQYHLEKSHSSILTPLVKETVEHAGIQLKDLNAIAISEGPGSYTGLRIGTSTAKGLCFGLDIPLIAVSTLLSMASGMNKYNPSKSWLCPMLDARRMEVYCLVADHNLQITQPIAPKIITEESLEALIDGRPVIFFGDGSNKCKPLTQSADAVFIDGCHPSAADVGDLAWSKYQQQDFVDLAYFEPFYLKAFKVGKPKQLI